MQNYCIKSYFNILTDDEKAIHISTFDKFTTISFSRIIYAIHMQWHNQTQQK